MASHSALGGPVTLTDRPVFEASAPMRVYWRGATYDTYTGSQWLNTDQQVLQVEQGKRFAEPIFQMTGAHHGDHSHPAAWPGRALRPAFTDRRVASRSMRT